MFWLWGGSRSKGTNHTFLKPIEGPITSNFGERINPITKKKHFHNGVDIYAPEGTPILAPSDMVITANYYNDVGGNQITAKVKGKLISFGFAHLSKSLVKLGQVVNRGDVIGYVGSTGQVTGPHLHLVMKISKSEDKKPELVNPLDYFKY